MPVNQIIQFRRGTASGWTLQNPTLAQGELGYETDTGLYKVGNGTQAWISLAYGGLVGPTGTNVLENFGDGSDGNVTISSGTTTLARDQFYANLTINGTGSLVTNGYKVFVSGTLDITSAPAGAIQWIGVTGGNAAGATGGGTGTVLTGVTVGGSVVGQQGRNGGTGAGPAGNAGTTVPVGNGGAGGTSGAAGLGSGGAGGAAGAGAAITVAQSTRRFETNFLRGVTIITGGGTGGSGGAGGGNGTNSGGGGGGSGSAGGVVPIFANIISRGASTTAGAIRATGGNGGNGAAGPTGANCGGGAGAGAAGGGWVYICYNTLSGATATNCINVSGGTGGNGGAGNGTGVAGGGGTGGSGGRVTLLKILDSTGSETFGSAGSAGTAASGVTPGTGGAGNTVQVSL